MSDSAPFSRSTLGVFSDLLNGYSLPANHPQFEAVAASIALAMRELNAAVAALTPDDTPPA